MKNCDFLNEEVLERKKGRKRNPITTYRNLIFHESVAKTGFNFSSKREGKFISRDGKDRTSVQLQAVSILKAFRMNR